MRDKLIPLSDNEHYLCIIKANPLIVESLKWFGKAKSLPPLLLSMQLRDKTLKDNDILSDIEVSDLYVVIAYCHDNDFTEKTVDSNKVLTLGCCPRTQIYIGSKKELIEYSKPSEEENEHDIIRMLRSKMIEEPLQEVISHNFKQNCYDFANCVLFNSYSSVVFDNSSGETEYQRQMSEFYSRVVSTNNILSSEAEDQLAIIITNILEQPYGSPIITSLVFTNSPNVKTTSTYDEQD